MMKNAVSQLQIQPHSSISLATLLHSTATASFGDVTLNGATAQLQIQPRLLMI